MVLQKIVIYFRFYGKFYTPFAGFDATGRQYDPNGNLVDWWDKNTITKFTSKTQCFIDQVKFFNLNKCRHSETFMNKLFFFASIKKYSKYKHPLPFLDLYVSFRNQSFLRMDMWSSSFFVFFFCKFQVNGVRTLDENIADNGGIKGMLAAYRSYVKHNGPDLLLPNLNYTTNQLFWISAAQTWCAVTRPIFDLLYYQINEHSPNQYRVIGAFSNMQNFSDDFYCEAGSQMNPVDKCQIW